MANSSQTGSSANIAFIVGGLVVAVGILAYFIFGGDAPPAATSSPDAGSTSVTIDNSTDVAPEPDAAAPADGDAAPADSGQSN
ncbi:hypothetical protein OEZ60_02140 [Defluviimonas sp. WL0024]|uniref:Dynamin n=2 Tax=Albidovulum TaxID=205889 RepID=A0ABT3J030_9RHOB|nr:MULTISPECIES: hypothetical protein [Defluviimonas]MCU9846793.1 hypothetical protein [Defluviimonas sp. WL0024]MCW3781052.1 hypothetical protein [Defluviimonas salinarum]